MHPLRRFYERYKAYITTDGLMYLTFVVMFIILFTFFRD